MRYVMLLFTSLLISACTPRFIETPFPPQAAATQATQPLPLATTSAEAREMISRAIADLAGRISIDPAQVGVTSIEPQLWPSSALGCPRLGEVYTPQPVPGYLLRLEANGQVYVYHTDEDNTVILCPEDDLPSFPVTPGEIDDEKPWMPVD